MKYCKIKTTRNKKNLLYLLLILQNTPTNTFQSKSTDSEINMQKIHRVQTESALKIQSEAKRGRKSDKFSQEILVVKGNAIFHRSKVPIR